MLIIGGDQVNAQWYQVNTNTTENLYDIFFVDSLEGYCVGGSDDLGTPQSTGVILKTMDGGENWNLIFSKDSLTIKSIAVVDIFGNKKLYAYGAKNGVSHLISTVVNTTFQNWSIVPINYFPINIAINQQNIFFVDGVDDNKIKILSNGILSTIINQSNIPVFGISETGLIYLNNSVDSLFFSHDNELNVTTLNYHQFFTVFGQNQITNSAIKIIGDTIIIKGTYPSSIVYSLDNGGNWYYNYGGGEGKSLIIETGQIISLHLNSNNIFTSNDFGQNWVEDIVSGANFTNVGYSKYDGSTFALGKNGVIYKNTNLLTLGINETGLKVINIYPNPAKNILQVENLTNEKIIGIKLFNINGKLIKEYFNFYNKLEISSVPNGEYILNIKTPNGLITEKVIITR